VSRAPSRPAASGRWELGHAAGLGAQTRQSREGEPREVVKPHGNQTNGEKEIFVFDDEMSNDPEFPASP